MHGMYSMRSPAVKRLMKEAQELSEPTEQYYAQPLEDNLFEWHFTLRGPEESDFAGGIYHGRIILPPEYPMKPPSIILLTPNGRFEVFKKICLSISGHHPESWQPSWSIRTALLAIIGFMPTHGAGAIGSLDYPKEEREKLSKKSLDWKCPTCGSLGNILKPVTEASEKTKQEAKELASQINFQGEKPKTGDSEEKKTETAPPPPPPTTTEQPSQGQFPGHFVPGQPPFPFPFMPPSAYQGQTPGSRFPPPPPVIPAMFPPGFVPYPGGAGNVFGNYPWNASPNFPGFPTQCPTSTSSVTSSSVTTVHSTTTVSSANVQTTSQSADSASSEAVATSTSATSSSTTSPSATSSSAPSPSATPKSATSASASNDQSSDTNIVTDPSTSTDSDVKTTEPNPEQPTAQSQTEVSDISQSSPPAGGNEGLRQRQATVTPASPGSVGQSAELHNDRQSGGGLSLVAIVLLSIAIGLLLIRRFFLSRSWSFYYGFS